MKHSPAPLALAAPLAATALLLAPPASAQALHQVPALRVDLEAIVLTDGTLPGPSGPLPIVQFSAQFNPTGGAAPAIDRAGNVGIVALVDELGVQRPGVWKQTNGITTLLGLGGLPAPGAGTTFDAFPSVLFQTPPAMTAGMATFAATVVPQTSTVYGLWSDRYGAPDLVLLEGDPAPGLELVGQFRIPSGLLFPDGTVLISAQYADADDSYYIDSEQEGFWRDQSGVLSLVLRDDLPAPGTPPGVVFGKASSLYLQGPFDKWTTDSAGLLAFNASLKGPGVTINDDEGVWIEAAPGSFQLVVREGDPAPQIGPGFVFGVKSGIHGLGTQYNTHVKRNEQGSLLFGAGTSSSTGFDHVDTLWRYRDGQLEKVAAAAEPWSGFPGDDAPGIPGFKFPGFFLHAAIADDDEVAFQCFTPDDDGNPYTFESGIWRGHPGALSLVVRTETRVPGIAGAMFNSVSLGTFLEPGLLSFHAALTGPGVTLDDDRALFLADAQGSLHLVLREGQLVDVAGDGSDLRAVESFGLGPGVSDDRELALEIDFTDGTGGLFRARCDFLPLPGPGPKPTTPAAGLGAPAPKR